MYLSPRKKLFVDTATEMFGEGAVITKSQKTEAAEKAGVPFPTWFKKCKVTPRRHFPKRGLGDRIDCPGSKAICPNGRKVGGPRQSKCNV